MLKCLISNAQKKYDGWPLPIYRENEGEAKSFIFV